MHQFPSKGALMKGLLEHQVEYFGKFSSDYLAAVEHARSEPNLAAQIATLRETIADPHSVSFVILAALVEDPALLSMTRELDAKAIQLIKAEATDPDLSMLRWAAARGLALSALFGLTSLSEKERNRLFDRLLDDAQWPSSAKEKKPRPARPARKSRRGDQRR